MYYLCNGKNPVCCDSIFCHLNGGECCHTSKAEYSENIGRQKELKFVRTLNDDLWEIENKEE